MYSRPSASQMRLPAPRSMNGGTPPTARNARTGEFTPPGMILRERSNSRSFFEAMGAEHVCKFTRASFYFPSVEQSVDHSEGVDACLDQGARVLARDASDRHHWARESGLRLAVQRQRRAHRAAFGARRKGAAEGNVVGTRVPRGEREIEPVVARSSQDPARTQTCSRCGDGRVVAPDVKAVGSNG